MVILIGDRVEIFMNALVARSYEIPERADTNFSADEYGEIERSNLRLKDDMKADGELLSVSNLTVTQVAVTQSQSTKLQRQKQQLHEENIEADLVSESDDVVEELVVMNTVESEIPWKTMKIGMGRFPPAVLFDDLLLTDFKRLDLIQWFDRAYVRADTETEFRSLALY